MTVSELRQVLEVLETQGHGSAPVVVDNGDNQDLRFATGALLELPKTRHPPTEIDGETVVYVW